MGMPLGDFEALTPDEFRAVCEQRRRCEEERLHDRWERMRLLATIVVQPSLRRKMTPKQLLRFPWDEEGVREETKEKLTKEEHLKRFTELVEKYKDGK